jgi:hypothetical protein
LFARFDLVTALYKDWFDAVRLSMEAQQVIALRLMRLSAGTPLAAAEAQRMFVEKAAAAAIAANSIALDVASGRAHLAIGNATAPVRRRVRANRRRLSRK